MDEQRMEAASKAVKELPGFTQALGQVGIQYGKVTAPSTFRLWPWLCPACDLVHFSIVSDSGLLMNFVITQEAADRLADALNAPGAMPEDGLRYHD